MARQVLKDGDEIVFGRCKQNKGLPDVTIGKIYKVEFDDYELMFLDDAGDYNYTIGEFGVGKPTKIIK